MIAPSDQDVGADADPQIGRHPHPGKVASPTVIPPAKTTRAQVEVLEDTVM